VTEGTGEQQHMATAYMHDAYRDPAPPPGGYLYATPRDVLTGEPIRPDTIHVHVTSDGIRHSKRTPRRTGKRSSAPLPILQFPASRETVEAGAAHE